MEEVILLRIDYNQSGPRIVNPRSAGPLYFPPHDRGLLRTPPPLTRLLGHVATGGKAAFERALKS